MVMFTAHTSCLRTIRSTDPDFTVQDGMILATRAGFEIDRDCPREYRAVLQKCIDFGWIKPIAVVRDAELMWDKLST